MGGLLARVGLGDDTKEVGARWLEASALLVGFFLGGYMGSSVWTRGARQHDNCAPGH